MAEGPGPPGGPFRRGCTIWFAGQAVAALVGMGLGLFAMARNAPFWLIGVAVLGPPVLYALVVFAILGRWLFREYREFSRNAPSPESVAAPAGGAGVEASPFRDPALHRAGSFDGLPTVPAIATDPGKVLAHRLLEADLPPGCQFGCTVFAALFWNGILSIFVWRLVGDWNRMGGFKWLYVAFLSPFALVGIGMVLAVLAAALELVRVEPRRPDRGGTRRAPGLSRRPGSRPRCPARSRSARAHRGPSDLHRGRDLHGRHEYIDRDARGRPALAE